MYSKRFVHSLIAVTLIVGFAGVMEARAQALGKGGTPVIHWHYRIVSVDAPTGSGASNPQIEQLSQQGWVIQGSVVCPAAIFSPAARAGGASTPACVMLQRSYSPP
jgi:hypothetical protein